MKKKNEQGFSAVEFLIIAVVIVIVGAGAWFVGKNNSKPSSTTATTSSTPSPAATSEQPDKTLFNQYFSSFSLAKLANGKHISPPNDIPTDTTTFNSSTDQLCQNMIVLKQVPSGSLSSTIYSVATKQNAVPVAVFPGELGPGQGTSSGCGTLGVAAGRYEYKAYINNVLVVDIPFEVK
ncbi:hypothetical protein HYW35_00145 [Candidatus Saccharibacteria bacterium]|nr:hypothetical protein [Candidatus Saccharibacteria bacterium]